MPIEMDLALKLARYLMSIPGFSPGEGPVEGVAQAIARFCDNEADARWVVAEASSEWHEWKGPAGLKDLLYAHRYPERPPSNQVQDYGPRPAIDCDICQDWGYFTDLADPQKLTRWCDCETGVRQKESHPGLVEALNRSKLKPELILPAPTDPNQPQPTPSETTTR